MPTKFPKPTREKMNRVERKPAICGVCPGGCAKPLVLINPADALNRKICNGDTVIVYTRRGCVSMWAKVTDAVLPGGVKLPPAGSRRLGKAVERSHLAG